jgi:hypothetical protein
MNDTPETYEAVERWNQGKINIFDEMARLERERDKAIHGSCVNYNFTQDARRERDEALDAIRSFYKAKGRHNSQIAAAKMFELAGLPAEYPRKNGTK